MAIGFRYTTDESKITELAGVTLQAYYADLRTMVSAQDRANALIAAALNEDRGGHVLSRGHVLDAEVMGCGVAWPEDEEPMVSAPALDGVEAIQQYRPPDPDDNPIIRRELAPAKAFYEMTGERDSVSYNGPVTVAAHCLGMEAFLYLAAAHTALAEQLVRKVNHAILDWAQYHDQELGIPRGDSIGAADDTASFLSPALFGRLCRPCLEEWYAAAPGARRRHLHICGNTNHLLGQLRLLGLAGFDMGEMVNLPRAIELLGGTHLSRILDFRLLRDCDDGDIEAYVLTQLVEGEQAASLTLKMEGWRGVPLRKARLVKEVVERYNRQEGH